MLILQAEFYQQGQQYGAWQWQPQGYQPMQQAMYGGYPQQDMNYNYYNQYDNSMMYNQHQGMVNYDGQTAYNRQSASSARSKHSYSQNRSKNRQRPEVRQNIMANDNENSNNSALGMNNDSQNETSSNEVKSVNLNDKDKESVTEESQGLSDVKVQDKSRNRGGRFHGTDTRTRKFDTRQQVVDRQRGYDRKYDKGDRYNSNVADVDIGKDDNKLSEEGDSGARPKSYKDSRNNYSNRRDRYTEKDRKNGQEGGKYNSRNYVSDDNKSKETIEKSSRDSVKSDGKDSDSPVNEVPSKSDFSGKDRKKKKEYQVYSSSNSPRDWQVKPNQPNSPRDAYDRYNYRGQDYNKRHKEINSQAIERGGDRTKLSIEVSGEGNSNQDEGMVRDDDGSGSDLVGSKNVKDGQRKSKNAGPQRGSRFKQKSKMDESQRGYF